MPKFTRSMKHSRSRSRKGGDLDSFVGEIGQGIKNTGTALADTTKNVASNVGTVVNNTADTVVGTTTNAANATKEKTGNFFANIWPFKSSGGSKRGGSSALATHQNLVGNQQTVEPYETVHSVPSHFDARGTSYMLSGGKKKRRGSRSKKHSRKGRKTHKKRH